VTDGPLHGFMPHAVECSLVLRMHARDMSQLQHHQQAAHQRRPPAGQQASRPAPTVPSSSSTSFTLLGPMSHWQVSAVASALSWQEKVGRGRENMTLKAPGSQEGNSELRMARVRTCRAVCSSGSGWCSAAGSWLPSAARLGALSLR
jgi:hypothetical protein